MKERSEEIITAIDIGSSKIVTVISEVDENGSISVIGIGRSKNNDGVRNGVVININSVVESLGESINEAEMQAGREIRSVYVGVSGKDVESINSKGVVAIAGSDKEIRDYDVERVIENAKAVPIPLDREILHIIPQGFTVDGQDNIRHPVGMVGTRLESQIHIVTTAVSSIQNVKRCFERIGINVRNIVLQNIASARAVLTSDEKELGVLLVDIGSETVKVSIYHKQAPVYSTIYHKLGGYLVTSDLSIGLKVSIANAEKIKTDFGIADYSYVSEEEAIEIPSIGGRGTKVIPKINLVHIIKPRLMEIFGMIKDDIEKKGYMDMITGGVVVTGGSSYLPGLLEVCQEVFNVHARVGIPKKMAGIGDKLVSPEYSVACGLVLWGYENYARNLDWQDTKGKGDKDKGFKKWFKDIFEGFF